MTSSRLNSFYRITTATFSTVSKGQFTIPTSHDEGGAKLWKFLSLFIAAPVIVALSLAEYVHKGKEDENKKQPPFIPYEHLRLRTKRFPWGDGKRTLFHNPEVNPLPDGYEVIKDE